MRSMRACARSLLLLTGLLIAGAVWSQEQRGWLGVETENLAEQEAGKLGLQAPRGAKIVHTVTGSPAAAAGLEPGEVIVDLDGVNVENDQFLTESLKEKGAGATRRLSPKPASMTRRWRSPSRRWRWGGSVSARTIPSWPHCS